MNHSPLRFLPHIIYKGSPIHLTLFVTRRCNARCSFCFYSAGASAGAGELTLDEYRGISRSMGPLLWLALSGGEIFLREDIVDIIAIFYRNNRPSIILLPTNGLMPESIRDKVQEIIRQCPKSVVAVKLSLDGMGSAHDDLRGVKGAFEKTLQSYHALAPLLASHNNFELGVNTVFCSANQDNMDEIIDFVGSLKGIKTHTISLARGDTREPGYREVDMDKYARAIDRLEHEMKDGTQPQYSFGGARIKAAQDIIQRRLIHRTVQEDRRQLPCYAGRLNLVVTETGDFFPCESFRKQHLMGNLRERVREHGREHGSDISAILGSEHTRQIIREIGSKCFCTHECYMMTNILFNPRMYPRLLKEYLRV